MRLRFGACVFVVGILLASVVAPVSAQENEAPPPAELGDFESLPTEDPGPLPDGTVHPDAAAAAEEGFDVDGSTLDGTVQRSGAVSQPRPNKVSDEKESARNVPASTRVPDWARAGRSTTTDEPARPPKAIAPGRKFRFAPDSPNGPQESSSGVTAIADDGGSDQLSALRLVRPASEREIGMSLVTLDETATAEVSNAGLAFELEVDREVRGGRPLAPPGLDKNGGRKSAALGPRSGWELHIDLNLFAGTVSDVWATEFRINYGCNPSGNCKAFQALPTQVDEETATAVVELPANVMAALAKASKSNPGKGKDVESQSDERPVLDLSDGVGEPVPNISDGEEGALSGSAGSTALTGAGSFSAGTGFIGAVQFQNNGGSGIVVSAVESAGNYSASRHSGLAEWQVGIQSGHAELSYPIPLPPGNGYVPDISFSYSSGAVDGMNRAENAQASAVGVGWSEHSAVISREVIACTSTSKNLCTASGNRHDGFNLSFNGVGGPLVRTTDSESGVSHPQVSGAKYWEYRLQNKNDWRIWRVEQVSGGPTNGDSWSTWWEVTTGDGTLFVFGREFIFKPTGGSGVATLRPRGTNWSSSSQSLQTIPIYFWNGTRGSVNCPVVAGYCSAGLAWHLDQVIDTSGNQTTYQYSTDTNRIKTIVNGVTYSGTTVYERDVVLDWFNYGRRFGDNLIGFGDWAPFHVNFSYGDRKDGSGQWVGVPTNLDCTSTSWCAEQTPSFYSKKKMTAVGVFVGNSWKYGWALHHSFPEAPGESGYNAAKKSKPKLWLDSFERYFVGRTTYNPVFKENRVNYPGDISPMRAARVGSLRTENGGYVTFTYGQSHPPTTNSGGHCYKLGTDATRRKCDMYPAYDAFTGSGGVVWWHKWKVLQQDVDPRWGGSQVMTTTFNYPIAPDWAHAPIGKSAVGYWNDYRGHRQVDVVDATGAKTSYFFYTGMYEDKDIPTSSEPALVKNAAGVLKQNRLAMRGMSLGTVTRAIPSSSGWAPIQNREVIDHSWTTDYSVSRADVPGRFLKSYRVTSQTNSQDHYNNPSSGSKATTQQVTTFDWMARPSRVRDRGLTSTSSDDFTTFIDYKNSASAWIYSMRTFNGSVPYDTSGSKPSGGFMSAAAFEHDSYGRVTKSRTQYKQGSGSAPAWADTTYQYNDRGQATAMTVDDGPRGGGDKYFSYGYNSTFGYRTSENGPLSGNVDRYTFQVDPTWGAVTKQTDPNGRSTDLTYDNVGRLTTVKLAGSSAVNYKYTYAVADWGADWVKTEVLRNRNAADPNKYIPTWEFFDGIGRSIQNQERHPSDSSLIGITATRYDNVGRVLNTTEPKWDWQLAGWFKVIHWNNLNSGWHWYEYPRYLNTNQGCDYGNNTQIHSYDANDSWWAKSAVAVCGLETRTWDRSNRRTTLLRDGRGNVTRSTNPAGDNVNYTYNQRSDLTRTSDHFGNNTDYQYWSWEAAGPNRVIDPDRGQTDYVYDGHGRVRETKDARQTRLIYGYDNADRPTNLWYSHSSGWKDVSKWTYDNGYGNYGTLYRAEHWNRATDSSAKGYVSEKFTYDSQYRTASVEQSIPGQGAKTTSYTYLDHGGVQNITQPNGQVVKHSYDSMGRVSWMGLDDHTVVSWVSYNERGQIGAVQRGVDGQASDLRTDNYYDHRNGRLGTSSTIGVYAQLQQFQYAYEASGNITQIAESGAYGSNMTCVTYDNASRMTKGWTRSDNNCGNGSSDWSGLEPFQVSYTYDQLSNIKSAYGTGTVDGSYQYSSGHTHAPSQAGSNNFQYDAVGNRTQASGGGQTTNSVYDVQNRLLSTSGAVSTENLYTTSGERARRTVNGSRSWYYRSGYELDNSSQAVISMTLNGSLVATWDAQDQLWTQASDMLGTPTISRAWLTGQTKVRRMTPFGAPRSNASTAAGSPSELTFTGQRDDVGSGLMYYGARYYDPELGQFTQPDTITPNPLAASDWNRYAYVQNNPLVLIDPTGRSYCPPGDHGCESNWQPAKQQAKQFTNWAKRGGVDPRSDSSRCADCGHYWLEIGGMAPAVGIVPDTVNTLWYLAEGRFGDAAFSGAAMIPVVGQYATAYRWANRGRAVGNSIDLLPGSGSVNAIGGTHNCASCVIAGDSTLAGAPASAIDLYPGVPIPGGNAKIAKFADAPWRRVSGRLEIERELLAVGDGARGVVYGSDSVNAHVWNAVVQDGSVNFVDFQGIGPNGPAAFDAWNLFAFVRTN